MILQTTLQSQYFPTSKLSHEQADAGGSRLRLSSSTRGFATGKTTLVFSARLTLACSCILAFVVTRIGRVLTALLIALMAPLVLAAQPAGMLGNWQTPLGSIVRIDRCGANLCLWIVYLSPSAPSKTDTYNPNPALRSRPLCGLQIGGGFTLSGPGRASGGTLYDPKSGKTYRGAMTAEGDKLELRGYVGIPLFGRSEAWTRAAAPASPCAISGN